MIYQSEVAPLAMREMRRGGVQQMVVVYMKNGEKAPLPDANYVKLDPPGDTMEQAMLRCFFGNSEVGQFKWDEVAGYTVSAQPSPDAQGSYEAWNRRLES